MNKLVFVITKAFLMFLAVSLAAQTTQAQAPDLPGEGPLLLPGTETSKMNLLTLGLRISSDFDDNALNSDKNQQENLVASIQPHLGWHLSRTRLDWAVDYTPGVSRSQSLSVYDSFSHLLDSRFQLKLAKRLRLRIHESFLKSTNPFDQLRASESAAGPAVRDVPNATVPATLAEVRTEQASADIVYALSAHSTAGIGGDFFSASYNLSSGGQLPGQVLQNTRSAGGHGYYSRQFSRRQWTGFDYYVQKIILNSGESWSLVHSLAYTHTIRLSRPMMLSFFAGPERSVTANLTEVSSPSGPVFSAGYSSWRWTGGATAIWSGVRTSLTARLSRRVSVDGILGAVSLSSTSAEVNRQFARQWTARLLASYDDSKALAGSGAFAYVSAAGGLTRTVSPNLSIALQYWRVHVLSQSFLPAGFLSDHNRISMSITYEFAYPLGR